MLRPALVVVALVAATLAVYAQTLGFGFVVYDDPNHVIRNPGLPLGLSLEGLRWAFTHFHFSNWTPLAWVSFQLDFAMAGMDPGRFHATNVALHAANATWVFLVLRAMTGALWRSALAAALFAVHPLHVESVAWISERRDVLSSFFGWLALGAWVGFARRGGAARYALAWGLLALALLSKPLWVTLPLLLLLLDWWPLGRLDAAPPRRRAPIALLVEKLPLLAASLGAAVMAVLSQAGLDIYGPQIPIPLRLAHLPVLYVSYLGKAIWPSDLSALYPHPYLPGGDPWSAWEVAGSVALLAAVSAVVWRARRRRYLLVGWLWFLIAMLPMSGLAPVGHHGMADRYAYLPLIGLYVAVAWGLGDLARGHSRALRLATAGACALWLAGLAWTAHSQVGHWRSSLALWEQAVRASPGPDVLTYLANEVKRQRHIERAIDLYRRAVEMHPDHAAAHLNLGNTLRGAGRYQEAIHHYREAMRAHAVWGRSGDVDLAEMAAVAMREAELRMPQQGAPPSGAPGPARGSR